MPKGNKKGLSFHALQSSARLMTDEKARLFVRWRDVHFIAWRLIESRFGEEDWT